MISSKPTGHRSSIDERAMFVEGNLGNEIVLENILTEYKIEAVMHFAANSLVGESVKNPLKYYENNVKATLILLKIMMKHDIKNFIFYSTAATYGIPDVDIINEITPTNPINPYGRSKLKIEQILSDYHSVYELNYVRYFNAAGAHHTAKIGEQHDPETHLIPIILQHLLVVRQNFFVFGTDYNTEDGTCTRDYFQ